MTDRRPTVILAAEQGFAARYLFRTDILPTLVDSGLRVVILSPHARESYFAEEFRTMGVDVAEYRVADGLAYLSKSRLQRRLRLWRDMTAKRTADLGTFDARQRRYESKAMGRFAVLRGRLAAWPVPLLRRSRRLRDLLIRFESWLFTPDLHDEVFRRYRPNLVVVSSLGNMRGIDALLMREARKHGAAVASVVLSWDNTSTRGIGGALPDHVVAWTPTMATELVTYYDFVPDQVFVGGVAHWDHYHRPGGLNRDQLFSRYGLDPRRRLVVFATASPSGWADLNVDVVRGLAQTVESGRFSEPLQVLVRLHPIYQSEHRAKLAREALEALLEAASASRHIHVALPRVAAQSVTFDLASDDAEHLKAILRHADVVVTSYSTIMLEACLLDRPVINVAFDTYSTRMGQPYTAVAHYPHLKRILQARGTRNVTSVEALITAIDDYLVEPSRDAVARAAIVRNECGPNQGAAGAAIGRHLARLAARAASERRA